MIEELLFPIIFGITIAIVGLSISIAQKEDHKDFLTFWISMFGWLVTIIIISVPLTLIMIEIYFFIEWLSKQY